MNRNHQDGSPRYTTTITAANLHRCLRAPVHRRSRVVVFDCSFDLAQPHAGAAAYGAAHIPRALYAHLDLDLSARSASTAASGGRHPLPTRQAFAHWLTRQGVTNDMQIVVYDRNNTMVAGRMWWMLKWLGHQAVAVLDGGWAAWSQIAPAHTRVECPLQRPLSAKGENAPASFELKPSLVELVDAHLVCASIGKRPIVDARTAARYRGEIEPLDPVAGHIPQALNRAFTENFHPDGTFRSASALKHEFASLLQGHNASHTIHYCGSGVSALPNVLAMAIAGFGLTALYAGSWSDWCSDRMRPVQTG